MSRILVLFAHPVLEKSRVQYSLLKAITGLDNITINDLYQNYPEFDIDVKQEKKLLLAHDIIIWQHPFYWYSSPALLKQWQDLVLEHGWAYGKNGTALTGKRIFNVLTSGGSTKAYKNGGYNRYPIHEYLKPFEQTAHLCAMVYWPPFWIPGVHQIERPMIEQYSTQYRELLIGLRDEQIPEEEILKLPFLNNLFQANTIE
jgi:glutathione-regulated potassium-efflux system ancillary protein KefG